MLDRVFLVPILLAAVLTAGSAHAENGPSSLLCGGVHHGQTLLASTHGAAAGATSGVADSQSFVDGGRSLANKAAKICLFAAWLTATYKSWSIKGVTANRNGDGEFKFRVFGTSAWTGQEIWVDVIMSVSRDLKVTGVQWGEYHTLIPPGSALKALQELSK